MVFEDAHLVLHIELLCQVLYGTPSVGVFLVGLASLFRSLWQWLPPKRLWPWRPAVLAWDAPRMTLPDRLSLLLRGTMCS
ncbi:hypothetical protein BS17DRAFT_774896 [Gyrodon lividus]|nr:hypothetical protein BS17DRAFT_774896 [Gyrodon lividus]